MTSALVVGDLVDDVIVVLTGAVRADTDTAAAIERREGGSPANTAAWMASSGASVTFVGRCGAADVDRHARALAAHGVVPRIQPDAEHATGTIVIVVEGEQRTMLTDRGANDHLDPDELDDALLAVDVVHLTGYALLGGHAEAVARLVERAHAAGARVSLTLGSAGSLADLGVDRALAAIEGVDVLLANLDEGRLVTGLDDPLEVAAALAERWPSVALTMGSSGSIVGSTGSLVAVPSQRVGLVDPTGAGDAFAAGFVAGLAGGADAASAAGEGARLAALAVATRGARPSA